MRPQDIIRRKRNGEALSAEEIQFFVRGISDGVFADYQAAALLMAIFLRGMTDEERQSLTQAMLHSGRVLDFSRIVKPKVDKHSTGGVGDKTSLIVAPLAAACGLCVPMISGRGLGHTGGTLDKLEAIPGYDVRMSLDRFRLTLEQVGFAMTGQTGEIALADKKLYSLRDVTATVESIPLIAASIMSKKLAEGLNGLVLDVKVGSGAFMKSLEEARTLAEALVGIGRAAGVRTVALVTDMNQPLGGAIGNRLEVIECFETLKGRGPTDLTQLSIELTAQMLIVGGASDSIAAAREAVQESLRNEAGLAKFRASIEAQDGDPRVVDDYDVMPRASHTEDCLSEESGYVARVDAETIGVASMMLGAGRVRVDDTIDPAVGVVLHKKIGDAVTAGEPLATLHYNGDGNLSQAKQMVREAFQVADVAPPASSLIKAVI